MKVRFIGRVLLSAAVGVVASTGIHAQSTTASIFGQGPAGATVIAQSTTGAQRHIVIGDKGRYRMSPVPMGTYTVRLEKDEKVIDSRPNITLTVGRGAEVDFACTDDKCAAGEG